MNVAHVKSEAGYSLVEMSIVVVIIGLLVGGVLVGNDLIAVAQVHSTISQIRSYETAMGAFEAKYGCIAGDCSKAEALGLGTANALGCNGNGNGVIDMGAGSCYAYESGNFWIHLLHAGLATLPSSTETWDDPPNSAHVYPGVKIGSQSKLLFAGDMSVTPTMDSQYWTIVSSTSSCSGDECPSLTPKQVQMIDAKLDDGQATTGRILALGPYTDTIAPYTGHAYGSGYGDPSSGASGDGASCLTNATPAQYNVKNVGFVCGLAMSLGKE